MLIPSGMFIADFQQFTPQNESSYTTISSTRDRWLQQFSQLEPYLASVVHGAVSIDKNRAWTITGGERVVRRFVNRFHQFENGLGWRTFMSKAAQSYYTTDMGFVGLVEFTPERQLNQINNIASHHCQLYNPLITGSYDMVVQQPTKTGYVTRYLSHSNLDYIRVVSMPNTMSEYAGLGFCAVSRSVEWAQLMLAIYQHDKEQLFARLPKGFLLLNGVSEDNFQKIVADQQDEIENLKRGIFKGVSVLASFDTEIKAQLVSLSQLPNNFDLKTFTDLLMYGYALAFGYPADEFWPLQGGSFGHSREVEMNEQRSSSKGVGNFILDLQEEIQRLLPDSLHFEFSRRDTSGDLAEAALNQATIDSINALYNGGTGLISREEARMMLAENGIIPNEWTSPNEDVTASDIKGRALRDELLDKERVAKARQLYPMSKIVAFQWPQNEITVLHNPDKRLHKVVKRNEDSITITDDTIRQALALMPQAMKVVM